VKIKLRELNGCFYMLINKEVKEMMEIGNFVDAKIVNGKIIVEKIDEETGETVEKE